MSALPTVPRVLSKSTLSLYLRTGCDRELYLSLFKGKPEVLAAAGLPGPLKSRPNVQLVTGAGRDFENDQYKMLAAKIPSNIIYAPKFQPLDLLAVLPTLVSPTICIQPAIEPENFRARSLKNLGLAPAEVSLIPPLAGLRPDVVILRDAISNDWEVLPDGNRKRLSPGDKRKALSVVDLKNVSEGNASYAAEVCLYAVFLANWLEHHALQASYYVSECIYLWTQPELEQFTSFCSANPTAPGATLVSVLVKELEREAVEFLQFMPSVRKFFREDVPRVITIGDSKGWAAVDYHVTSRCSACDWLGNRNWLSTDDKKLFNANPTHYCFPAAEKDNHLSRVPNVSRGARQVLEANAVPDVPALKNTPATSPVMTKHTFLKRERRTLNQKAEAILTGVSTVDTGANFVTLAKNAALRIHVVVTFDASASRLSGIGLHASYLPPWGMTGGIAQLVRKGFLVARNTDSAEWSALESFIDTLLACVDAGTAKLDPVSKKKIPPTQICFWEYRQYEELCKAFGRHLPNVLGMKATRQQAMAWLFPAEDLLEREDGAISPSIVFIKDIVERVAHLPVPHVYTLMGVAASYHHPKLVPGTIDSFYSEPLSNGIPRERTFEIWMNTSGTIHWGSFSLPIADAMDRYRRVLSDLAFAISSVVARLHDDFKLGIRGHAKPLALSTVTGKKSVAFDSKLWSQWNKLEQSTAEMEAGRELAATGERLESAYKAVVLSKVLKSLGGRRYEFEVSPESLEAKIDAPDRFLTLGVMSRPGFPLETGYSLGLSAVDPALTPQQLNTAMHKVIRAQLISLDRAKRVAEVEFIPMWHGVQATFDAALAPSILDVSTEPLFLLKTAPYDATSELERILEAIGDASNAKPDPNALKAMGKVGKTIKPGVGAPSVASRVLWEAPTLAAKSIRTAASAKSIADRAKSIPKHGLNPSQYAAVKHAAEKALSIIWGPPGTGKTDTVAAFVHALVLDSLANGLGRKILLTGPNYRAVEVLADRLLDTLNSDKGASCDFFRAYSKSRDLPANPGMQAHIKGENVSLAPGRPGYADLQSSLLDESRITLVATSAHATSKVASLVDAMNPLVPAFDVVVIDESSQVEVTLALRAIATMKPESQLIVSGDHLQMPPIASLDAPVGVEYMVGSIQTYFIERLKVKTQHLLENYRSNQDIVDYALTLGYPVGLTAANKMLRLHEMVPRSAVIAKLPKGLPTSAAWVTLLDPARPVCTLIHEDNVASQANPEEAKMVAALVLALRNSMSASLDPLATGKVHAPLTDLTLFNEAVGIVTPHKAQRSLILTELTALFPTVSRDIIAEAVDTVERFQGGERHTIIVSFGVGDVEVIQDEEDFLLQLERINVSVSRAMAKCIVILPKTLAYHLPSDKKTLKTAKAIKSYLEEFCNQRQHDKVVFPSGVREVEVRWHQ